MKKIVPMQSLYCSMQDENKICSFDIEVIAEPTTPLIHPMSRFWLVDSGEAALLLNNQRYTLKAGSFVSVLPWQITDIVEVSSPMRFYLLVYYFDNISEIMKTFYNPGNASLSLLQVMAANPVIQLDPPQYASINQIFSQIRDEIARSSAPLPQESKTPQEGKTPPGSGSDAKDLSNLYITNKLIELVICFLRSRTQLSLQPAAKEGDPSQIFLYLYSHLNEKITLAGLSKLFFMSESAISSYITSTTGLSFFDLLSEMRVGKTINYLLYTDFTLEELAEILGFVDSAHISKVFLTRIGMNANEFRNTYQMAGNICHIRDRREFYSLVSYIYRHYSEDLKPKEVGDMFGMSPRELNRILQYQVEMDFSDFLNFVRVNRASELLLETNRTILDIAMEVGYRTEKTLSRNFIRFRSMTPGKFRQTVELQKPN